MDDTVAMRAAIERNVRVVTLRPAVGQRTARTQVTLKPGLTCEVVDGPWRLTVGMSEKSGGANAGPTPGVLGRGALGSCLAICYAMWAARLDVPINALSVDVEADYDSRGELGVSDDVPPGYTEVRYVVTIESPAPRGQVEAVIDTADRYSPYRDVFARAHQLRRELRITAPVDPLAG